MDISVIICTHNPRPGYLGRVLNSLRDQTLSATRWELLVVDNVSDAPLTSKTCDVSWHANARILRENSLGLAHARVCGIREASSDLLVFVDDDNVLDPNYLSEVITIKHDWPQLGVWGGSTIPEFEVQPAVHLRDLVGVLARGEVMSPRWSNVSTCSDAEPCGAGMCVRGRVAAEYGRLFEKSAIRITGRAGKNLSSGEDSEICRVACSLGLGMGLFPELKVFHLIPKERVEEDYLIRIIEGIVTSILLLDYKWYGTIPNSPFSALEFLRLCKNVVLKRGIHRKTYLANFKARNRARAIIARENLPHSFGAEMRSNPITPSANP